MPRRFELPLGGSDGGAVAVGSELVCESDMVDAFEFRGVTDR
jgi:hypothetical protein